MLSTGRFEGWYLSACLSLFAAFAIHNASTVPLWFDECFTLFVSKLPSISAMLSAMPADGQPPLQYLLTHFSLALFGETELSLRLPELLAYLCAGALTYRIVRRRGAQVQALFAMTVFLGADINMSLAFSARPYCLLLASTAFTFNSWQISAERKNRRLLPLCGVSIGVAGAILSHHFGVIHVGLFLAIGEAFRLLRSRRIDFAMLAAVAAGVTALGVTLPLARQSRILLGNAILQSPQFWARPMLSDLLNYRTMVAIQPLCFIALFVLIPGYIFRRADPTTDQVAQIPLYEWVAAASLCLLLPFQTLLAALTTGYSQAKYSVSTSLGIALICGWGILRIGYLRRGGQIVLALSTVAYLLLLGNTIGRVRGNGSAFLGRPGEPASSPMLRGTSFALPIVIANAFDFAPDWYYSPPSLRLRLVYLADPSYAKQQKDFLPELSLVAGEAFTPLPVEEYRTFLDGHSEFLLLSSGLERLVWLPGKLKADGWNLEPIAKSGGDTLYRVSGRPMP